MKVISYAECHCGAITVHLEDGSTLSFKRENLKTFFPDLVLEELRKTPINTLFYCDHCVNHYGLDLCGCGSGMPFGKCNLGLPECKVPRQSVQHGLVKSRNSWF